MTEVIPAIELCHDDGWSYRIKAEEDETIIEYYEIRGDILVLQKTDRYISFEDIDIKIAEAVIRCRKMYREINT